MFGRLLTSDLPQQTRGDEAGREKTKQACALGNRVAHLLASEWAVANKRLATANARDMRKALFGGSLGIDIAAGHIGSTGIF